MSRRFLQAVATVTALSLLSPAALRAQDYGEQVFTPAGNVAGEATKAVVDRVFGVKGEAADIRYHAIELSNHSPVNAGIRSALLPGWGQWFNRQPVKAAALFTVIGLGLYGAVSTYERSQDDYDAYRKIGNRNDPRYDDYERRREQAFLLGGAATALWLYSIWDAYKNAYNPLWSQDPAVRLALHDDGASVELRRRF